MTILNDNENPDDKVILALQHRIRNLEHDLAAVTVSRDMIQDTFVKTVRYFRALKKSNGTLDYKELEKILKIGLNS